MLQSPQRNPNTPPAIPRNRSLELLYPPHSPSGASCKPNNPSLDYILKIQNQKVVWERVLTSYGGPEVEILLTKIAAQEWSGLFLQGTIQIKLAKKKVTEFYIHGKFNGTEFTSTIVGVQIKLPRVNVALIIGVPSEDWSYYMKYTLPPLHNLPSPLDLTRKFTGVPTLTYHRQVEKKKCCSCINSILT